MEQAIPRKALALGAGLILSMETKSNGKTSFKIRKGELSFHVKNIDENFPAI